ncbi:Nucleotidyltransferase [Hortaea werneckii]|nr:Nucleotidyltransferase [Hortaea werneckii]
MAGLSAGQRGGGAQHPHRPPIQSQHSNSVPSTPFQQPRDLHFHSRSPSPHRGLSNQSPRSVVSEAVGQPGPQRGQPVVCKFETGAEFRKRRIPYTEGGEKELEPPQKEPKKHMEPQEEDKLSGDMRELYDRLLPSDESEERRRKLVKKFERIMNDEWPNNDIRVNVFGSSGNLLSSTDSDVDICVTTPLKKLESMHSLAMLLDHNGMQKVVCRASAKVPIVKCWDPELQLACDLNVNNTLALENTRMIKTYIQLDDRVRPLAKIIKYWTKRRILNDAAFGGTISSYTWICMIINFLQRRDPPILPSLQKTEGKRLNGDKQGTSEFADDVDSLKGYGDANKETLAQLLFYFFRHYGYEFDYANYVISVKEGRQLSRKEKGWDQHNYWEKEAQKRLCVEEPFTTVRNLGNSADDYSWSGVHSEIRRAFDLLADGQQLDKACEQYEFPPEEKPVFQRPPPKPAPTLRRSASQSGRANHEQSSGRSRKNNNRNQSAQRAGNRRASSGASFGNQRVPLPFQSPPVGHPSSADYLTAKSNLHDQLFQQYQYLQAQQDMLRSQLAQHAQQQQQSRNGLPTASQGEMGSSSHHRNSYGNGVSSPRNSDNVPQTAPLLPGYLYHYPARYPPPSPMTQTRSREGTITNPSSPSLAAAVPALRRQVQRGPVPDGSPGSVRSQSQPGRSLPHPLALQQHVHPGYDVSGVIPAPYQSARASQIYGGHPGLQLPFSPLTAVQPQTGSMDSAMPKEYVGYYVGQSPHLGPQQYATAHPMQMPQMTLRDPPFQRPRKVTPDHIAVPNGRRGSRSPSPMSNLRKYSSNADDHSHAKHDNENSPERYEETESKSQAPPPADIGGPLIVNGSNPAVGHKPQERVHDTSPSDQELPNGLHDYHRSLPLRSSPLGHTTIPEQTEAASLWDKHGQKLTVSPNGTHAINGLPEHYHDPAPNAPLLSPVEELRTPSPTQPHAFDKQESPRTNGLTKAAKVANAKQVERTGENDVPVSSSNNTTSARKESRHERQGSAPVTNSSSNSKTVKTQSPRGTTPPSGAPANATANQNPWLQATKKGHKKSKSSSAGGGGGGGSGNHGSSKAQTSSTSSGQPMPANEAERKGG